MSRFLLAFVSNSNSSLPYSHEVFKVSEKCTAYDVTVPLNTIYFMFVHADTDSAENFVESFVTIKLGNRLITQCSIKMTPEEGGKRYWLGKIVSIGDFQGIKNEKLKTVIPIFCLGENDEVIDL